MWRSRGALRPDSHGNSAAGGEIEVKHEKGILTVDKWAEFEASPRIAVLVRELRAGVDRLLLAKVADPALDIWQNPAVAALLQLIATDGF